MQDRTPILYAVVLLLFVAACTQQSEHHSHTKLHDSEVQNSQPLPSDNWLFGQWVTDFGEGFELLEACKRPDSQFGKGYAYWRDDVDGDPYEELNKVDQYAIDGNSIKVRLLPPSSIEPMLFKDGTLHFELQSEGWVKLFFPKRKDEFVKLVRCDSSPFPYSADIAPTPPKYQGIEPGIADRPRGDT